MWGTVCLAAYWLWKAYWISFLSKCTGPGLVASLLLLHFQNKSIDYVLFMFIFVIMFLSVYTVYWTYTNIL